MSFLTDQRYSNYKDTKYDLGHIFNIHKYLNLFFLIQMKNLKKSLIEIILKDFNKILYLYNYTSRFIILTI